MRFLKWLVVVLVVLASAGWFAAKLAIENTVETALADARAQGKTAEASSVAVGGFPAALDLRITSLHLADPVSGAGWQAPELGVSAPIWAPWDLSAALPPGQLLSLPDQGITLTSDSLLLALTSAPDPDLPLRRAGFSATSLAATSDLGWTLGFGEISAALTADPDHGPAAYALVNPNRLDEDEGAAHGHLAAVGVAFLLGAALLRLLRQRGFFAARPEPRLIDLLDIVALGTVADVAALRGLNRAFVAQGLKVMAARRNIGLNALIGASRLNRAPTCTDLGFALGPRINAGGRVGKSDLGVRLLVTEDPDEARGIAEELDRLNEERRAIEALVQEAAETASIGQGNRAVALVAGRGWHPGVIGIVAGRLKEKLGRPSIVIAIDEDGVGEGSGRSISGVDLGAAVMAAKENGL
ncbi:MAG: DUF2125 domain-containing protein, partial [Actinobacteria bacterium]|nr:DUF2125 domain-containing protein [Actinomycetota bacterium]